MTINEYKDRSRDARAFIDASRRNDMSNKDIISYVNEYMVDKVQCGIVKDELSQERSNKILGKKSMSYLELSIITQQEGK